MTDYLPREIQPLLHDALATLPVVVLSGARQVGKSTLLANDPTLQGRRRFDLDRYEDLESLRTAPETLLAGEVAVTIDEAQRLPDLARTLKVLVDEDRQPGRFLLSGSANLELQAQASESLAGRALTVRLEPFSRRELHRSTDQPPLLTRMLHGEEPEPGDTAPISEEEILRGGMAPVAAFPEADAQLWMEGYEQTYIERDVRNVARIGDLAAFRQLLRLTALRSAGLLNMSNLARDALLDVATVKRYLSVLEATFVVRRVPAWRTSRTARLVKSPRVFITDSGLAAWLCGVDSIAPGEPLRGPLVETYVLQNLASIRQAHLPRARLHTWAVQGRHEVDFVLEHGRDLVAIEVKAGEKWSASDWKGLDAFAQRAPGCRLSILATNGRRAAKLGPGRWVVPLGQLLS